MSVGVTIHIHATVADQENQKATKPKKSKEKKRKHQKDTDTAGRYRSFASPIVDPDIHFRRLKEEKEKT